LGCRSSKATALGSERQNPTHSSVPAPATRRLDSAKDDRRTSIPASHVANGYAATLLTSVVDGRNQLRSGDPFRRGVGPGPHRRTAGRIGGGTGRQRIDEHLRVPATSSVRPFATLSPGQQPTSTLPHRRDRRVEQHGPPHRCSPGLTSRDRWGVNDRWQLALAEHELRAHEPSLDGTDGVTVLDPRRRSSTTVQLGRDVTLYPGHDPAGMECVVGNGTARSGPDARLIDCVVEPDCGRELRRTRKAQRWNGCSPRRPVHICRRVARSLPGQTTGAFYTAPVD
jgi:hypothetical protein